MKLVQCARPPVNMKLWCEEVTAVHQLLYEIMVIKSDFSAPVTSCYETIMISDLKCTNSCDTIMIKGDSNSPADMKLW